MYEICCIGTRVATVALVESPMIYPQSGFNTPPPSIESTSMGRMRQVERSPFASNGSDASNISNISDRSRIQRPNAFLSSYDSGSHSPSNFQSKRNNFIPSTNSTKKISSDFKKFNIESFENNSFEDAVQKTKENFDINTLVKPVASLNFLDCVDTNTTTWS